MEVNELAGQLCSLAKRFRRIAKNDRGESDLRAAAAIAGMLLPTARQHGLQLTFLEPTAVELQDNAAQLDVIAHLWARCWTDFVFRSVPNPAAPIPNPLEFKSEHRGGPNDIVVSATNKADWSIRAENYAAVCDALALSLAVDDDEPAAPDPQRAGKANKRMEAELQLNFQTVQGWTSRQWAKHLGCAPSTVVATPIWQDLMLLREKAKAERQLDRSRRSKPAKR